MNKKKILTLAMALSMAAILAIGGTIAYFTDTDYDSNVMVLGNVDIIQNEVFEENSDLFPAPSDEYGSENHVTKTIDVTNNGSEDAYVRTIIAFEDNEEGTITPNIHTLWNEINGVEGLQQLESTNASADGDVVWMKNADGSWMTITGGDPAQTYTIAVITYPAAVAAGATSPDSLIEVWLDDSVGNDFTTLVGGTYEIVALSQAVQAEGFADAETALDTAFGEVTEANLATWFSGLIGNDGETPNA